MNVKALNSPRSRSRGISLVEILLVISLLVIMFSFAIPSEGHDAANAEMKAAVGNIEHSIETARKTARNAGSGVEMEFISIAGERSGVITFSAPGSGAQTGIPDYRLPESIELVRDQVSFVFDENGWARNPGRLILVSLADETVTATVDIH